MNKSLLLLSLLSLSLCNLRTINTGMLLEEEINKQSYDIYVLAVQWSNGICAGKDCKGKEKSFPLNEMSLHGLWPSLKSGKEMKPCTSGVEVVVDESELFKKMATYWGSLGMENKKFWEHEYNKHGYCMVEEKGLKGYRGYFEAVLDLFFEQRFNTLITRAFPDKSETEITVTYSEMQAAIRKVYPNAVFKMNCNSGFITEFYFYLDKNYAPVNAKFNAKNRRFPL